MYKENLYKKTLKSHKEMKEFYHLKWKEYNKNSPSWPIKDRKKYEKMKKDTNSLFEKLTTYSDLLDLIKCYMIDVHGNISEADEESINKVSTIEDFEELINKCGGIASTIQKFIQDRGFIITDKGAGHCGWHLGVFCNSKESERLCDLLHSNFEFLVEKEVIRIERHFWGYKLEEE